MKISDLIALTISSVMLCLSAEAAPTASIPSNFHQFGSVNQGAIVEHSFELKNTGNEPLLIRKVLPSCGCTAAIMDSHSIAPGQTVAIRASFNTAGFQGKRRESIQIFTNDPLRPVTELTIEGFIIREVTSDPYRILFGSIAKGSTKTAEVVVTLQPGISISEISSRSEYLSAEQHLAEGNKIPISVTLKPGAPVGNLRGLIAVKTTSRQVPLLNIPVIAQIEGDLRFKPTDVSFGLVAGPLTSPLTANVVLENSSPGQLEIVSVSTDNPSVRATVKELEPGRRFQVNIAIVEGFIGTIRARVQLFTNHPDDSQREISLPVYGIVAAKGE